MSIKPIVIAPSAILRKKSLPVDVGNENIMPLLQDMHDTMNHLQEAGLAAVQIGSHKRVFVISPSVDEENEINSRWNGLICFINPEIYNFSKTMQSSKEGCLSVPEQSAAVIRHQNISIKFFDHNLQEHTIDVKNFYLSICIQHEADHLDGKLYIDKVGAMKRNMMLNKAKKIKQSLQADKS